MTRTLRRPLLAAFAFAVLCAGGVGAARAECIDNGHYTIAALAEPMVGTRYPYTEDLVHHGTDAPVGDDLVVEYHDDLRWTKIQSGCAAFGEYNVVASTPVNLLLRASFRIAYMPEGTAPPPETRYEVQLRVGTSAADEHPRIAATETRFMGGRYPRSERFAATLQDLPAGSYVYSFWFRLLDGPPANRVKLQLQWITAQGVPNVFPSERRVAAFDDVVREEWMPIGLELRFRAPGAVDAILQASFIVAEGERGSTLTFEWVLDGLDPGARIATIATPAYLPSSEVVFEALAAVEPGEHVMRLYAKSTGGAVRLRRAITELVAFPAERARPVIPPLVEGERSEPLVVTTAGSDVQPASMSTVCGRWTKLLAFELPPADNYFSWTLSGYVEILDSDLSGYVQIGIDAEHDEPMRDQPDMLFTAQTDMGMFELQLQPGHDGAFFYGDCSKWGNGRVGNRMSLWLRRIEGCNDAPFGGTVVVGRRWLAMKLLPSEGPHLP
ncbi:MAG TPA: hypothetical protein VN605_10425 [Thermoanaerobaculia bacterium]|nr:hypothetical protein [Thermoanaerobaculia bacterium]